MSQKQLDVDPLVDQAKSRAVTGGHTSLSPTLRDAFRQSSKGRPWAWPTTGFEHYPTADRSEVRLH